MNTKSTISFLAILIAISATAFALFTFNVYRANGLISTEAPVSINTFRTFTFFATTTPQTVFATTTSATSTNITAYADSSGRIDNGSFNIAGAKLATVYFSRGGVIQPNTGSTMFRIEVTPDGTNWYTFNKLIQSTSTTQQSTATITAATSTLVYGLDLSNGAWLAMRCIVLETTDGEHSCSASASF